MTLCWNCYSAFKAICVWHNYKCLLKDFRLSLSRVVLVLLCLRYIYIYIFHPLLPSSSQVQTVRRCSLQWETAVWALWVETPLCCSAISPREPPTGSSPFWTPCGFRVEHARCHQRRGRPRAAKLAGHPHTPPHQTAEVTRITQRALSPSALSAWPLFAQLPAPLSGTRLCRPCWLLTTCWEACHLYT